MDRSWKLLRQRGKVIGFDDRSGDRGHACERTN